MNRKSFHPSDQNEPAGRELAARSDAHRSSTHSARAPGGKNQTDVRCHCGSLMARVTGQGIELKCRRCKRVVTVPVAASQRGWVMVELSAREDATIG